MNKSYASVLGMALVMLMALGCGAKTLRVENGGNISAAVAKAAPGDVVTVEPGEYAEVVTVKVSGIEDKQIVIRSAQPRKAKVKGFKVEGDYITIEGFEVTNSENAADGIDCGKNIENNTRTGCRIINNYIHDITGTGIYGGEYALVKGNLMRNVGRGIFINSFSLAEDNEVDTLVVTYMEKNGEKKIKKTQYSFYAGEHITFRGNYFHGAPNEYLIKGMGVDFFVTWDAWIFGPSSHILIENNRCFDATHASESEANKLKQSSHVTFRNNLFVNTVYVGIYYKNWTNIKIYNNTFINCGAYPIWFRTVRETEGAEVKNNLIAYYKHDQRTHGGPAGDAGIRSDFYGQDPKAIVDCDYNMMWATENRQYGEHDFTARPVFVDPDNGDFRLKAGSPGIDAGMTLGEVKYDQDGTSRPQGKSYDVGAYEYVGQ